MGRKASPNKNDFSTQIEEQEKNIALLKKEIQIEAALEKVRARTMAMQKTEELPQIINILFQQLQELLFDIYACSLVLINERMSQELWIAGYSKDILPQSYEIYYTDHLYFTHFIEAWQNGISYDFFKYEGQKKKDYDQYVFFKTGMSTLPEESKAEIMNIEKTFICAAYMKYGWIEINAEEGLPTDQANILQRFAKVFEQIYTRFLDVKKAEAQTREAEIQLAIERVRARTMAMHRSEELGEVAILLYKEFNTLKMGDFFNCGFVIVNEADSVQNGWMTQPEGDFIEELDLPYPGDSIFKERLNAWSEGNGVFCQKVTGEKLAEHIKYVSDRSISKNQLSTILPYMPDPCYFYCGNFKEGYLHIVAKEELVPEAEAILARFTKVFSQTYTRFLDLQKAEAQAREARIETALEKIRSNMMAMHQSDQLRQVVATMFEQLQNLGFDSSASVIHIYNDDLSAEQWMAGFSHGELPKSYHIPYCEHPYFTEEVSGWQAGLPFHELIFEGPQKVEYAKWMIEHSDYQFLPAEFHQEMLSPERIYISNAHMKYGLVEVWGAEPLPKKSINTLIRFAKVFEQTYTRFLDLQKAEKQAKGAQIETALEKVRSRTMAMHSSQELGEAVDTLLKQFKILGFDAISSWVSLMNPEENTIEFWTKHEEKLVAGQSVHISELINFEKEMESWKKGEESIHLSMPFKLAKLELKKIFGIELVGAVSDTFYLLQLRHKYGFLGLGTLKESNEEIRQTVQRFAKVFEQTYTRFLDLQKAEKQAKEAQIETALEKVRSRTMAMQKSEELLDLVKKIYSEIEPFGVSTTGITIALFREEENAIENWFADNLQSDLLQSYKVVGQKNKVFKQIWEDWKNKNPQRKVYLEGPDKRAYDNYILTETDYRQLPEELKEEIHSHKTVCFTLTYFKYGYFESVDLTIPAEENAKILLRFAKVFEQTYTRFLDLQKAEAQAKEAEIELALERVRARTMAMHHSDELIEVVKTLNKQFLELRPESVANWLSLVNVESNSMKIIGSVLNGFLQEYIANGSELPSYQNDLDEFKKGIPHWQFSLPKEEILRIWRESFEFDEADLPEAVTEYHLLHIRHAFGFFGFGSWEKADEETIAILSRFCKVFEQTYTRFLDLQKAEAQTREAEIELALERVRAKTMAMQKSDELSDVAALLFKQIKILGAELWTISIAFCKEDELIVEKWGGSPITDQIFAPNFIPYNADHGEQSMYDTWKNKVELYSYVQEGKVLKDIYDHLMTIPSFKANFQKVIDAGRPLPVWQKNHVVSFKYGYLLVITEEEFKEEYVFTRFAKVFEQTYTRFLDLQKAEEQAKEALKQSSLDRVRGEIASMRSTADLERITPLVWNELTTLGVPFIRCGVSIIHEETQDIEMFLSTPNGESLAMMNLDYTSSDLTQNSIDHWRKNKVYHQHWSKEEFVSWTKTLMERGQISNNKAYQGSEAPPETLELYFVPFTQGSLYVGAIEELSDEEIEMVKALAKAFSIAYARYEDFVKLEKAKDSIEATLAELKNTQKQLIQSEKMASLGELTAGIAHEIQNPLNFVNNFSEVSAELVEEIQEARAKKQDEKREARGERRDESEELEDEILEDIKKNLEKINHHGKRADAIVKGMLEHSRTGSGEKELTDINSLAGEYLNLAYQSFKSKNEGVDIKLISDFDPSLPNMEIVRSDIGKVLLNILNNAFYAVGKGHVGRGRSLQPMVTVSTRLREGSPIGAGGSNGKWIQISISDNGPGIPDSIKDKIFQPFFTTKPTGQGTGLGLSLSYDIVKAHGGSIKILSNENEGLPEGKAGTEFSIELPLLI